jgi:hypothetical protein
MQVWMHELVEITVQFAKLIHKPIGAEYQCKGRLIILFKSEISVCLKVLSMQYYKEKASQSKWSVNGSMNRNMIKYRCLSRSTEYLISCVKLSLIIPWCF